MFDYIIKNGTIIDGSGDKGYLASVGIKDDSIEIISQGAEPEAKNIIDATGLVISPGFIDMHSHCDLYLFHDPYNEPKIRQGVTTEVIGQDGLSYAPASTKVISELIIYLQSVNGDIPGEITWNSVGEYLDSLDGNIGCNIAYLVPHSAVRTEVMGWTNKLPNESAIKSMQQLIESGMKDGAFGFSTGLTYVPNVYSDTNELIELAKAVKPYGGMYVTHCRYGLGDRLLDPFKEAITIGVESGVPVQISHYHSPITGMGDQMVTLIDQGLEQGVDLTFDQYPYPAASTLLASLVPPWVHEGVPRNLLENLQSGEVRESIKEDVYPQWGGSLEDYYFSHIGSQVNQEWVGRSFMDLVRQKNMSVVDVMSELLVEENLNVGFVARTGNSDNIRSIIQHPHQMVGSDGIMVGENPNPRTYGTFPYILGQLVREEGLLTLESAIHKMTGVPSQRLGLNDRGLIKNSYKADLVIFNPDKVGTQATFESPKAFAEGINYVMVNGKIVLSEGVLTRELSGRALRK